MHYYAAVRNPAIRHGATDVNFTMRTPKRPAEHSTTRTPKRPAEHSTTTQTSSALAWLSDTAAVQTHCEETRSVVARLLASGGGFARVPNFLPKSVAEACNEMLTGLPAAAWELMSRDEQDDEGQAVSTRSNSLSRKTTQRRSGCSPKPWRRSIRSWCPPSARPRMGAAISSTRTTTRRTSPCSWGAVRRYCTRASTRRCSTLPRAGSASGVAPLLT